MKSLRWNRDNASMSGLSCVVYVEMMDQTHHDTVTIRMS